MGKWELLNSFDVNGAKLPRLHQKNRLYAENIEDIAGGALLPQIVAIKSHGFSFF